MKKNMKFMRFLYLVLLFFFVLFFQTIVYSAINSTLNISGDAIARSEADVRITDFRLASTTNSVSNFEEFGKSHIITEVNLIDTTSSITYYIEITNYGSTDVGIFDITGLPDGVTYSLSNYNLHDKICDDAGKCNSFIKKTLELTLTTSSTYTGNVQLDFDFRIYHKVTYKDVDVDSDAVTEVISGGNIDVKFSSDYERVIATAWEYSEYSNQVEPNELFAMEINSGDLISIENIRGDLVVDDVPPKLKLVKGDVNTPGSEVCIGSECFYILSSEDNALYLISKYNLYVGGVYDGTNYIEYENPTYKQDSTMLGYVSDSEIRNGVFSFDYYMDWFYGYDTSSFEIETDYGREPVFIDDMIYLAGCSEECLYDITKSCKCENMPEWISNTSFWVFSFLSEDYAFVYNSIDNHIKTVSIYDNTSYGLRVIMDSRTDEIRKTIDITIDGIDYKAEEGMTWGEWYESEYCTDKDRYNIIGDYVCLYDRLSPDGFTPLEGLDEEYNTHYSHVDDIIISTDYIL